MRFVVIVFLILCSIQYAQTVTDTVYVNGLGFIDSLVQANFQHANPIKYVFFSSEVAEQEKSSLKRSFIGNCSEIPILHPSVVRGFDTLEYFQLQKSPRASFNDSLDFLRGNDISDQWVRVYVDMDTQIVKLETLGKDINVDFGKVTGTAYYKNGKLAIYINYYCIAGTGIAFVKTVQWQSSVFLENNYAVYDDKVIRQMEYK